MANTFNFNGHVMNITAVDTDWVSTTHFKGSPRIKSVGFFAAAQNDRCILRSGSAVTDPIIYDSGPADANLIVANPQFLIEEKMDIVLDESEGTYNAAAVILIILNRTS